MGSWTLFVFHLFELLKNLLQVNTGNSYKENTCHTEVTGKSVIANIILEKAKSHSLLTLLFMLKIYLCSRSRLHLFLHTLPKVVSMLLTIDTKFCAKSKTLCE